jgi:serine/threonine-protein kinase
MTLTGSIMGTAQYLSPEQAQGFAVSAASDLYSIGVILYELLTGAVPFEGETAVAIAFKQVSAAPRPPSELNPAIPPSLDAVVLRALAKDPAERYADADELITALERERQTLPALSGVAYSLGHRPPGPASPSTAPLMMAAAAGPALDGEGPVERERRSRTVAWALLAILAVAAAVTAFLLLRTGTATVRVPYVVGTSAQAAQSRLRAVGLVPAPASTPSSSVGAGLVISTSPSAGSRVDRGSRVALLVSAGPRTASVVDVTGQPEAQALARLRSAGFRPQVRQQTSPSVAAGRVIATEPRAGTRAKVGSPVTVLVSSGPAPVKVPDLRGESLHGAESALAADGLSVGTVTRRASSRQPPETVLSQSPAPGSSVKAGAKVNLTVAKAPTQAAVPDVLHKSEAEAAAALGEAGFKPRTVATPTSDPEQVEKVITQSPSGGRRARKGSTVTIGIGVLSTPTTTPTTPSTTPTTPTTPAPSGG